MKTDLHDRQIWPRYHGNVLGVPTDNVAPEKQKMKISYMSSGYSVAELVSLDGFLWALGAFSDCSWLGDLEKIL